MSKSQVQIGYEVVGLLKIASQEMVESIIFKFWIGYVTFFFFRQFVQCLCRAF
jgi:hypothetical protein